REGRKVARPDEVELGLGELDPAHTRHPGPSSALRSPNNALERCTRKESCRRSTVARPGEVTLTWTSVPPGWVTRTSRSCSSTCGVQRASGTWTMTRSEEHTSELQSRENLVCRLLLEKKKEQ